MQISYRTYVLIVNRVQQILNKTIGCQWWNLAFHQAIEVLVAEEAENSS